MTIPTNPAPTVCGTIDERKLHDLWTMGNCRMTFGDFKARILAAIQPASAQPVAHAAMQPDRNISPICQPETAAKVDELATIVRMLARHVPHDKQIKGKALDYLRRHGLRGSPLRALGGETT